MENGAKTIRVASLFSGCGGGDLGMQGGFSFLGKKYGSLGFEIVWANDILPFAAETYRNNIGTHIVEGDITKIKSSGIPAHDLLVGGFPCQSFSMVGERRGFNDPRGRLYKEMLRVLKDKQPAAFIGENVKGLVSIHGGKAIQQIVSDFESAGYRVVYRILNASRFGVPQKRERVFIVGVRKDRNALFQFPDPIDEIVPLKEVIEDHRRVGAKYYFSERALDGLKKANKAFNKGRAQNLNSPCNTISTHLAKVSLNSTDPVLLVKDRSYRRLTPSEAARIQSFPENFVFAGSDGKKYIQIGNAIPPVLMWHIAKAIKEQIFDGRFIFKTKAERNHVPYPLKEYIFGTGGVCAPAQQESLFSKTL